MANWVNNDVRFIGSANKLEKLKIFLSEMQLEAKKNGLGVATAALENQPAIHIIEMRSWEINDTLYMTYMTNWSSNEKDLIQIADKFAVGFIHDAFEPGSSIYQRSKYLQGEQLVYAEMQNFDYETIDFDRDSYFPT